MTLGTDVLLLDSKDQLKLECIKILASNEQMKLIGEELSNATGRAVIVKLFEGITSISAIARSLNLSIPLVMWHIQRLLTAGLIVIDYTDISRNRRIQHFKPTSFAMTILHVLSFCKVCNDFREICIKFDNREICIKFDKI